MSRTVPSGSESAHSANTAPSEKSEIGPAAETTMRRRRGSNHASLVSTNAYGKMKIAFNPARSIAAPERRHRQPVRGLVHGDHREAPEQEHQAAQAELRRDHERRPVAPDDQRDERRQAGDDQHRQRDQHGPREEHPAAAPVDALDQLPDAAEDLLARLDELLPPLDGRLGQRLPAGHALEEAALGEIGQQPREPRRARRPVALLGQAHELDQRMRPVEHLEDARVVVREPQECPAGEIAQHPALAPLGRVEALERVARAHARLDPEVRAAARWQRRQTSRPAGRRSCAPPPSTRDAARRAAPHRRAGSSPRRAVATAA